MMTRRPKWVHAAFDLQEWSMRVMWYYGEKNVRKRISLMKREKLLGRKDAELNGARFEAKRERVRGERGVWRVGSR